MKNDTICEGKDVLLFLDSKRTYLIKVEKGQILHTHKGYIKIDDIIGKRYGEKVASNLRINFVLFKPTINDYIRKMNYSTQIIYPKDIALIVNYANISSGSIIVEAGTGSGVLTSALAYYVKPNGKVHSYEVRLKFLEKARKNIERTGLMKYIEFKKKDITLGIDEKNVDSVILDLATPWLVVSHAYEALKAGGAFVSFSPTIEQTVKTTEALRKNEFVAIKTVECMLRRIKVKEGQTRPETLMIGHTGYITKALKTFKMI